MDRVKSPVAQCVCRYLGAYAFIGDDGGDPAFRLLPPVALVTNTCRMIFSDRFPLMSSSQCCIALHVQGLLHIARCKSGIVPAPRAEALEDYSELIADWASQGRGPRPCDWSNTSTLPAPRHYLRRTRRRSHRRTARLDHRVGTLDAHPGSQSPCYARHLWPGRQVDY